MTQARHCVTLRWPLRTKRGASHGEWALYTQYMYYIHYYHPPSVIHSDMVYDSEYMTGLYQREAQTLWIVTSSSECYI